MQNATYYAGSAHQVLEGLAEPSAELTLVHVGTEVCRPFHVVSEPRTEYIIHFVLSGAGYYSARGSTWPLGAGQMFLIHPGEAIVYGSERNDPWSYAWIGFQGVRAESILKQCGFSKHRLVLPYSDSQGVLDCIQGIIAHKTLAPADMLDREACMIRLFAMLVRQNEANSGGIRASLSGDGVYVELATDFIKEMFRHSTVGVESVADHIGISRTRLNRAFQRELRCSVQHYLIEYRLRHAAMLLQETPLSIKEIAARSGYSDQLVFSKAFKQRYGASPRAYRMQQAQTGTPET